VNGHRRARGRGQTLVEFALVLPLFLLILMILVDFGRVVYAQHTVGNDAREASRLGAVSAQSISTATVTPFRDRYQAIRDAARRMSPAVDLTNAQIKGKAGNCPSPLPSDTVTPGFCFYPQGIADNQANPPRVYVQITVTVPILTPIISDILGGAFTVTATSEALLQS
jgi:Flp pilus assembly protein TadG